MQEQEYFQGNLFSKTTNNTILAEYIGYKFCKLLKNPQK